MALSYLACPFRHEDLFIQRKRCAAAHFTCAALTKEGKLIFSPLTHNEKLIEILNDTIPGEQWMQLDLEILKTCSTLYILKMDGWEKSKGVAREIAFAKEKEIEIIEIEPPDEIQYLHLIGSGVIF